MLLAEQSFNYDIQGQSGFDAITALVGRTQCYQFTDSSLRRRPAGFQQFAAGAGWMTPPRDLIVTALLTPAAIARFSDQQWDLLIRQARRTKLLARLAHTLERAGLAENSANGTAPASDFCIENWRAGKIESLRWEVACICKELADAGVRVTLLKGAAYAMAKLAAANGRSFSDIDILVPKAELLHVESELMLHGWQGGHHDAYDQRYYRRWMHEIPPLRHVRRGTTLDVHHAILPETARVKVNTPALLAAVVPLEGHTNLYVLQPVDMLLHSATHLFHEGDFEKGLRDLFDLDSLLRQLGAAPGFWEQLVPRAVTLGLTRPLYYALRYTTLMLGTPVPLRMSSKRPKLVSPRRWSQD